jgi:hypothetical protein
MSEGTIDNNAPDILRDPFGDGMMVRGNRGIEEKNDHLDRWMTSDEGRKAILIIEDEIT